MTKLVQHREKEKESQVDEPGGAVPSPDGGGAALVSGSAWGAGGSSAGPGWDVPASWPPGWDVQPPSSGRAAVWPSG